MRTSSYPQYQHPVLVLCAEPAISRNDPRPRFSVGNASLVVRGHVDVFVAHAVLGVTMLGICIFVLP